MQKSKITRYLLAAVFLLYLFYLIPITHAAETVLEVGIPGVAGAEPGKTVPGMITYIRFLYTFVLGFVGIAGFASLVFWGAVWTGSGIIDKKRQAIDGIKNSLTGIAIALTAFIILNTINPDLTIIREPIIPGITLTGRKTAMITTGSLDPQVADLAKQLIINAKEQLGLDLYITERYRSPQEQATLVKSQTDAGPCESYHQYGLAFDVAIVTNRNSNDIPSNIDWKESSYAGIGKIGKSLGFIWGGDWERKDSVHFEYKKDKNIAALKQQCFQDYNG